MQVLITANYMACEDSIMKLELQFPYSVDIYENGILAVCKMLIQLSGQQKDRQTGILMDTLTDGHADRQTDRQTDRQAGRQAGRQTHCKGKYDP